MNLKNNAKGGPTSNPKVATHTSEEKKRKFTNAINVNLQQKY